MQEWRTYRLQDRLRATTALITVLAFVVTQTAAYALPTGGVVSGGSATINSSGSTMNINQASNKAIIDWSTFNIGSSESVKFIQPSSSAIALNRIHDNNPSQILGNLSANGQVWLLNSNGVMFGQSAQVNVGGMLASTANISNSNFMAGNFVFDQPGNPNGSIINNGNISVADGGLLAMVAPTVINNGTITARLGMVQMASGDTFTLDMYGDGLINLAASNAVTTQLVRNSGKIVVSGGKVSLTAATAANVMDSLINMDGVIQADSVGNQNGVITLYAAGSNAVANNVASNKGQNSNISTVEVSGNISAQGVNTGETGGSITVTADHVGILTGANINASGNAGGGTIQIGGDFHGQGTTPTALATVVESGAKIYADAVTTGNGGNVTVWSDNYTNFAGSISARGGSQSGNGGYVETSGHMLLSLTDANGNTGMVDASAPHGQSGTWLLDPYNVTIGNFDSGYDSLSGANPTGGYGDTTTSTISASTIDTALNAGTNVTITTGGSGSAGSDNGDITVNSFIAAANNSNVTLTLSAYRDITFANGVGISTSGSGTLGVTLTAANSNNQNGYITIGTGTINSNGGDISMSGIATINGTVNAGAGNITISVPDFMQNNNLGGIIVNNGGSLSGNNITLHSYDTDYGEQVRLESGSQLTATTGITLQDDATRPVDDGNGYAGVFVNSAAIITTPTLTVQTGGAPIHYDVTAGNLPSSGNIVFSGNSQGELSVASGVTMNTSGANFSFNGITTINGTINAGAGNITITDVQNNANNGGIIVNNGGSLSGYDIALHSTDAGNYGAQIRLNSGSQITGTHSVTLQDDSSTQCCGSGYFGVELNSGAIVTTPTLTVQTGGSNIDYNGAALSVSGTTLFNNTGSGPININNPFSIGNLTLEDDVAPTLNAAINSSGNVTFRPFTASTTIGVLNDSDTLNIDSGILAQVTAGSITIGAASVTGQMDVSAGSWSVPLTLITGSGTMNINGAQTMGANYLTLQTDGTLNVAANLSGTGTLTILPSTVSDTIGVNATSGSTLLVTPTDLGYIQSGFANIVIGSSADSNTMSVNSYAWNAPLTLDSGAGNVNITNGSGSLDFSAHGLTVNTSGGHVDITATGDILLAAGGISTNGGTVTLDSDSADTNGSGAGGISLASTNITTNGGAITLGGGTSPTTMAAISSGGNGIELYNTTVSAAGGNVSMIGQGYGSGSNSRGINLEYGSQVSTTGGNITMTGTGKDLGGEGIYLDAQNGANTVSAQNGNIALTGVAYNSASGIELYATGGAANTAKTTGSGNITLTGTGNGGAADITITNVSGGGINVIGDALDAGINTFNANNLAFDHETITTANSGSVVFTPRTAAGTTIAVAGTGSDLNITTGILGDITAGSITIGSSSDTGTMTVGAYSSWAVPVSFISGNSGSITVAGAQAATGRGSFAFTGPTMLDNNITTAGGNITFNSAVTLGANSVVNAEIGAIITGSTVAAGSHNLTLTADSLTLGGAMTGTGALTVQPYSASTNLHINDGTSSGWFLNSTELGDINNASWSGVTIGNSSDSGAMTVGAYSSWANAVSFLSGSGSITVSGAQSSSGSFAFTGPTILDGSVTTGGAQTYNSAVTIGGNDILTGGAIDFNSTVNDASSNTHSLTVSGSSVTFGAAVGSTELATLNVTGVTTIVGNVTTGSNQTYNSAVTIGGNDTLTGGAIDFVSTVNDGTSNTHALTVSGSSVTFGNTVGTTELASLNVTGATTLDGSVTTGGAQDYAAALALGNNVALNAGSSTITFASTINGDHNLTADAGTFSFGGAIGGNTALAAVSLTSTNGMTLPSIHAASIIAQTTGANADFALANGTTIDASGAGNAIVLVSGRNFVNDSGSNSPLTASSGDWHVYSTQASGDTNGASVMNPATTVYSTTYPTITGASGDTWFYSAATGGGGSSTAGGSGTSGSGSGSNSWLNLQFPQFGNGGPCGAQGGGAGDDAVAQAVGNGGCNGGGSGGAGGSASLQLDPNSGPATATLVSSNNQRNSPRNNIASSNSRRGGSRTRRDQDLQLPDLSDL